MGELICRLLNLYVLLVFARVLLSWFPISPGGAMASVYGVLYNVTEPVLGPVRRMLPSIGMIDLSPIIIVIAIQVICSAVGRL